MAKQRHMTNDERSTEDARLLMTSAGEAQFLHTDTWRVLRIMGEFVEGFEALAEIGPAVTIFGSARIGESDPMYQDATETARQLGEAGYTIITGGGPGIMEAGNRGAREAGARSVGLNIELPFEQHSNPYVDIEVDFRYFFVRKTMLVKYAQAFVIFPGGFGTFDELFEALVLVQTGKVRNFPIILYQSSYWQGLIDWIRATALPSGKIASADLDLLILCDTPTQIRETIQACHKQNSGRNEQEARARAETRRVLSSGDLTE
ncbi:MAG: TIGR00730 family Rossman fold protein [Roseiflexaceae bacterium]|nr:TIGR00730 family Rossman fold protein [Roseiflexaceae bacterium]